MIKQIGVHRVKHGDVMDGISDLMNGETVDIIYSDPPWGQGNLRYWQTMNKKMTGATPKEIEYTAFIKKIFEEAKRYTNDLFFLEYGIKWREDIKAMAKEFGFQDLHTIPLQYKSGSRLLPLDLHVFSGSANPRPLTGYHILSITGSYGFSTLEKVLLPIVKPGMKILDPCCGMGYTAQLAVNANLQFFGNELNEKRLSKTIKRLEALQK